MSAYDCESEAEVTRATNLAGWDRASVFLSGVMNMWRLWKILKGLNLLVVLALAISALSEILVDSSYREQVLKLLLSQQVYRGLIAFGVLDLLFSILSFVSYKRKLARERFKELLSEFAFLVSSEELVPEHMGFEEKTPNQEPSARMRPYNLKYVSRALFPGENETEPHDSSVEIPEAEIPKLIMEKEHFIILGSPTSGKSRFLYEALKKTPAIKVLKPRKDILPSNEALQLCRGILTVVLLDDLNELASSSLDIQDLSLRLDQLDIEWTLVCGCRGGTELSVVKQAVSSSIRRLYRGVSHKFVLKQLTSGEKLELLAAISPDKDISTFDLTDFPTVGTIVMADALAIMADRFRELPVEQRYCLSSMQMLVKGGILPLTLQRVTAVQKTVFETEISTQESKELLIKLDEQSFLISRDPELIIPEMAYLRERGPLTVVTDTHELEPKKLLYELVKALDSIGDAAGIFYAAIALGALGHIEEEIEVYNDVVRRFGEATEVSLREPVAMALFNKGITLGQLKRSEEAIEVYNDVVRRFGEATEASLRERVAKALVNKGVTLGELERSEEEIEVYNDVVRRFGEATEVSLRERVAKALVNKGVTLGQLKRREEAFTVLCEAWRKRGVLSAEQLVVLEKAFRIIGRSPAECP